MVYLWPAVDAEGEVLDVLVQSKPNKHAALKLMRKLLKKYAFVPKIGHPPGRAPTQRFCSRLLNGTSRRLRTPAILGQWAAAGDGLAVSERQHDNAEQHKPVRKGDRSMDYFAGLDTRWRPNRSCRPGDAPAPLH
jgi:transposase-like protein